MNQQPFSSPYVWIGLYLLLAAIAIVLAYIWLKPETKTVATWVVAAVISAAVPAALLGKWSRQADFEHNLKSNGVQASVTILKAQSTNMIVNRRAEVRMLLEIQLPGEPAFQQEVVQLVPFGQSATPGRLLPAYVDRSDPSRVLLDWESAAQASQDRRSTTDRLEELERLHDRGLISESEYQRKREQAISEL